jgi:hypothetical protein
MLRSVLFAALFLCSSLSLCAQCGGTERWQVKVGTDSGVARVQLSPVTPKTIAEMNSVFEPDRPSRHDNDTRVDEEVNVYEVRAHDAGVQVGRGSRTHL